MDREIKFRAWSKKYKGYTLFNLRNLNDNGFKFIDWNDMVFMQYTGLKDKNGVEIYEGDTMVFNRYPDSSEKTSGLIEWDDERAGFVFGGAPMEFESGYDEYSEVIGNIYENPELLED